MRTRPDLLGRLYEPVKPQPGAVYLLPHVNRERFKVGWSTYPMLRARQLPEFQLNHLDLPSAEVAWFGQAQRARHVERVLHRSLAPYRIDAGHHGDGHTEWFAMQGIVLARRMIDLLPAADGERFRSSLQSLTKAPDARAVTSLLPLEYSALDAWHRVEDLWLRLLVHRPLQLATDREQRRISWMGLRQLTSPGTILLRSRALNLETYEWREEGRRRSLVSLMDWERDDLLLHLTPTRQLQRWAEGDAVDGFLRAFLARHAVTKKSAEQERALVTAGR